jgi:plastocyanin
MPAMRRLAGLGAVLVLVAGGCGDGGGGGSGAQTRTVKVDYNLDEFATSYLSYFPRTVTVRPGDTVEFQQDWTGEPHSVTMGTLVDRYIGPLLPVLRATPPIPEEPPPEVAEAAQAFEQSLPPMMDFENEQGIRAAQNGAQPCYLDQGEPPKDLQTPCPKRPQPDFNGRQSYYNSGFIPYEGDKGNEFTVRLADEIQPGSYSYYCNYHGPTMWGEIVVRPPGSEVPSRTDVDRQGRAEIQKITEPLRQAFEEAEKGEKPPQIPPEARSAKLAGTIPKEDFGGFVSEFLPRTVKAKVNEKVTWAFLGGHTVSFDVPKYFPQITVAKDGTIRPNPQAYEPERSPRPPEEEEGGEQRAPPQIDAGRWDGKGFISSGVLFESLWSITFTKPGTYKYACVVHPRMVGTVEVT